jgi:hypothetical protein
MAGFLLSASPQVAFGENEGNPAEYGLLLDTVSVKLLAVKDHEV